MRYVVPGSRYALQARRSQKLMGRLGCWQTRMTVASGYYSPSPSASGNNLYKWKIHISTAFNLVCSHKRITKIMRYIRSCRSTLSSRRISLVNVRWKAFVSGLSYHITHEQLVLLDYQYNPKACHRRIARLILDQSKAFLKHSHL